jgi:hypothetical protein
MNKVRYSAALLLILTGILHALPFFNIPREPGVIPVLAFGIVYLGIGIWLIFDLKFATALGIIFPLLGLISGIICDWVREIHSNANFLFAIDVIVFGCCTFLYLKRAKTPDDIPV